MAETSKAYARKSTDSQLRAAGWDSSDKSQFRIDAPASLFGAVAVTGCCAKILRASDSDRASSGRRSLNVFPGMQSIPLKLIPLILGPHSARNFSAINSLVWGHVVCFSCQKRDSSRLDGLGAWQRAMRRFENAAAKDIYLPPTICGVQITLVPQLGKATLQCAFAKVS